MLLGSGPLAWRARASFPWISIDPARLSRAEQAEAAIWIRIHERQLREGGPRSADPGQWGNALSLRITRSARVRTETRPGLLDDGFSLRFASLAGVETASVLELSQAAGEGPSVVARLQPAAIDTVRGLIRLPQPLAGFDMDRAIRVASVEFDLEIFRDGQLEQRFGGLAPDPAHSVPLTGVLARSLELAPVALGPSGDPLPAAARSTRICRSGSRWRRRSTRA
ncbi:hypothetical protein [Mangrovicoccus ximenensis]|uniref:hypothetical protein n=1 Tax=Mangrovicoccus ximenensis TaxID=1911570 RepID=UPI000D34A2B6|nr:hypothetical protein [Mangrovicoccus ximenensis]